MAADAMMELLASIVERWDGRAVPIGRFNALKSPLSLSYLSLTLFSTKSAEYEARDGLNLHRLWDVVQTNTLLADMVVGARGYGGRAQRAFILPEEEDAALRDRAGLVSIIDFELEELLVDARRDYIERWELSNRHKEPTMARLGPPAASGAPAPMRSGKIRRAGLELLLREASGVLKEGRGVELAYAKASWLRERIRYANSEGARLQDRFEGVRIEIGAQARDERGVRSNKYESVHLVGADSAPDVVMHKAYRLKEAFDAEQNSRISQPSLSRCPVLAYFDAASTILHEALVHPLELNVMLDPSLQQREEYDPEGGLPFTVQDLGSRVGARGLSVTSRPELLQEDGRRCWGSRPFDLEGVRARAKPIICDGVLVGALATRNEATWLRAARGYDLWPGDAWLTDAEGELFIHPRQSNLVIDYTGEYYDHDDERGRLLGLRSRFGELLRERGLEYGLVVRGKAAEIDVHGRAMMRPGMAWRSYADGSLEPVKDVALHFSARDALHSIVAAGGKPRYIPGLCGVGDQYVRIGMVTPALIFDGLMVNRIQAPRHRTFK